VLELFDEAVSGTVGVGSASEVVAAQILVVAVVGEQVPADDQDGVAYGDGRLLLADPPGQAPELGREVSVAGMGGGPGALRKDVAEPDVALDPASVGSYAGPDRSGDMGRSSKRDALRRGVRRA